LLTAARTNLALEFSKKTFSSKFTNRLGKTSTFINNVCYYFHKKRAY